MAALKAAHAGGKATAGLNVETGEPADLSEQGIVDLYSTKWWALRLAADAAVTVLKVDQIIMVRHTPYMLRLHSAQAQQGSRDLQTRALLLRSIIPCACSTSGCQHAKFVRRATTARRLL